MIPAVIFDLDDTLYPEHAFVRSGFAEAGRWLQAQQGVAGLAAEAGRLFAEGRRGRIFDEALLALGVAPAPALVARLVAVYRSHVPQLELYADAAWALDHCGARGRLGLLTDGYAATQRNKVAALGIAARFQAMVFTDDHGRENWKPSPAPFQRIALALDCPAAACVYVGDNPAKDFVAPNRLGWRTVHLRRAGGEYAAVIPEGLPADHRAQRAITSLRELGGLLA